jgi:hypothetical protein
MSTNDELLIQKITGKLGKAPYTSYNSEGRLTLRVPPRRIIVQGRDTILDYIRKREAKKQKKSKNT